MKREFFIDTPRGRLRVWAKHETDCAEDYPGVYIDLCDPGGNCDEMLACVEYNSSDDCLQSCVYQPGIDEPVCIIRHDDLSDN